MTASVLLNELFEKHARDLDGSVYQKVMNFIIKFQSAPTAVGFDLKTPKGVKDKRIKSARVDDYWRAVLVELKPGTAYTLVAVKQHDPAYDFAQDFAVDVNAVSGALEITNSVALSSKVRQVAAVAAVSSAPSLLGALGLKVKHLNKFGITDSVAEAVMALPDEDTLLEFVDVLPKNLQNILLDLGSGRTVDEVWAEHVPEIAVAIDTEDFAAAAASPASRVMFTDGSSEELRTVLEGSFRRWRIWLHPTQRAMAEHDGWNGPARVTGGAGTGKTVTALHRARHLAKRMEAIDDGKILVTTYTRNLAGEMESQLLELAGAVVAGRTEVTNIDRLVHRLVTSLDKSAGKLKLISDSAASFRQALDLAVSTGPGEWDADFVQGEWSSVVLAQGLSSREAYLKAPRAGRSRRLSKPQRAEVWDVMERLTQYLANDNVMTYTQAAARAADLVLVSDRDFRYRHAIVDEAQDLHPAHWRLLRNLVPAGKDDIFIAGDAHQRIYGAPFRLSNAGINIVGRSRKLTVNYRTSRQILAWCVSVMNGEAVDDLDDGSETLQGARSEFSGPAPTETGYATQAKELAGLVDLVKEWHDSNFAYADICVMTRYSDGVDGVLSALQAADLLAARVDNRTDESKLGDKIRVMTMHRGKGLEYRAVALVNVSDGKIPAGFVKDLSEEDREQALLRERNLLYVAGSRAREALAVSWSGQPSTLLSVAAEAY